MGFIPLAVLASGSKYVRGEEIFTTSGTFTVPDGVHQISVVCVGGGGGGNAANPGGNFIRGAGGAGLGWKNNISVTPGQSISVVVGAGGDGGQLNPLVINNGLGFAGGDSYIIDTSTVVGRGGKSGTDISGGTFTGDGGGNGGNGGNSAGGGVGGGGGAGGYSGKGGNGAEKPLGEEVIPAEDGQGGAGGGGGYSSGGTGGAGGGVGIFSEGVSGTGGGFLQDGNPGSGGTDTTFGGAGRASQGGTSGADGGNGAVRIIWGKGEVYPTPRNRML